MLLVRMRRPVLSILLLASCSALCWAQTAPGHTVAGTVVNSATGEPIHRALVAVGASLVFSGVDGRFQVDNVPAGQITIAAQKPGYFECASASCPPGGSPARVTLNLQSATSDVLLKLLPESKIRGRVVDEDGDPVSDIRILILGQYIFDGLKQLRTEGGASTDENGNYWVENLFPGTYMVKTLPRPAFWSDAGTETPPQVYPQRFFPDTPDAASAQTLNLHAGQVGVADFTVNSIDAFRITGSVAPVVPVLSISVDGYDNSQFNATTEFDSKTGKFGIYFIPAGTWTLDFSFIDNEGRGFSATQPVTVASHDVKGIRVMLQPFSSVRVNTVNGPAQVQLIPTDSLSLRSVYTDSGPPGPDGQRVIAGLTPGHYKTLVSVPGDQCVDSVSSGNIDLTREDLIVAPGAQPQPITVTLRNDCAALQVGVRSPNPNTPATILLIPASRTTQPVAAEPDQAGSHVFTGLSPGEYQVYAFSSLEGLEYANPEAMREFSGQQITLSPNQRASITLDVIARGEK